jgi:hypothetical protein
MLINSNKQPFVRIVIPVVVGSSPISHPTEYAVKSKGYMLWLVAFFVLWRIFRAV